MEIWHTVLITNTRSHTHRWMDGWTGGNELYEWYSSFFNSIHNAQKL